MTRRGNLIGEGGLAGSSESHKIGTVLLFHIVPMTETQQHPRTLCFATVIDRPILGRVRSMFRVHTVREDLSLVNFSCCYDPDLHTLIHVDSIAFKIMLVPHYDQKNNPDDMCAIRMWESR